MDHLQAVGLQHVVIGLAASSLVAICLCLLNVAFSSTAREI